MPRLSRLRLVSVGYPDARMDDMILDFRDARQRAVDSTLWLRNGGGKSSIVTLLFSTIRPHRREMLGADGMVKRALEDYVRKDDRSVVVCEWELDADEGTLGFESDGERLLTGVFCEWKRGTSGDRDQLQRNYFSARVSVEEPRLTLEGIPLYVDHSGENGRGRSRRTLAAFRQEWLSLRNAHPGEQVLLTDNQREWQEWLEEAGIDPELYAYQVLMNRREGAADERFQFKDHEAFIDFLLQLAGDPEFAERCRANIETHRRDLQERNERLVPERDLLAGLVECVEPLLTVQAERQTLATRVQQTVGRWRRLREYVGQRISELKSEVERQAKRREREQSLKERAAAAADERGRLAAALRRTAAAKRLEAARAEAHACRADMEQAIREARLWEAAVPLRNSIHAEREAQTHRQELQRRQRDHQPLYDDLCRTGGALAAALETAAGQARARQREFRQAEAKARKTTEELHSQVQARIGTIRSAESRLRQIEQITAEAAGKRNQLTDAGILREGETGQGALVRLDQEARDCERRITQLDEAETTLQATLRTLRQERSEADRSATSAAQTQRHLEQELDDAVRRKESLEQNPHLSRILEAESVDLETLEEDAARLLCEQAQRVEDRIVALRMEQVEDERSLRFLQQDGLLPPSRDVEALLKVLRERLSQVWSGWAWLSENVTDRESARRMIAQAPYVVAGIVVRDEDFGVAADILRNASTELHSPVMLAARSAIDRPFVDEGLVVGPSSDAFFDRTAARRERDRLSDQVDEITAGLQAAQVARQQIEELATRITEFREHYPRGWFATQREAIEREQSTADELTSRVQHVSGEIERTETEIAEQRDQRQQLAEELGDLRRKQDRMESFVEQYESRQQDWQAEHEDLCRRRDEAAHEQRRLEHQIKQLQEEANTASNDAVASAEDATKLESELAQIGHRGEPADAAGARPLDELRTRYQTLRRQYELNVKAADLEHLASAAQANAGQQQEKLLKLLDQHEEPLSADEVQALLNALPDWDQVEDRLRKAQDRRSSAQGRLGRAEQTVNQRQDKLDEQEKLCRQLGDLPELTDHLLVAWPEIRLENGAWQV